MIDIKKHTIRSSKTIAEALLQLNELGEDLTLFVVDISDLLLGTITDGDIRRGLLKNISIHDTVDKVMKVNFKSIDETISDFTVLEEFKALGIQLLPTVDSQGRIRKILNLNVLNTVLPVDVVIMAGGEGRRLRPLTEKVPKPLLAVGKKPILEHNIDRLINFGAENFWICIGYLGDQIERFFGDGANKGVNISYIKEEAPLGTIGAARNISGFRHDHILVINSDVLTNIDYKQFYMEFLSAGSDLAVATIPYNVNVPYAVLETSNGHVVSFKEKPTYTYHSNAGIYLIKKEALKNIPPGFFNATDLMEHLIKNGQKVISYPLIGYWLDIGKHEDYAKANEDIKHIKF
ncbi:MAG: nucleotidyltransferase family protein [Bacteroidetes bacterium]|nr:nucleotidyltransferase family protein [Bacteroidota bacterium]